MNTEVHTLGCRANQYESDMLTQRLGVVGSPHTVHLVNTCAVTALAERKGRRLIRHLRRAYPESIVLATGCQATVAPESLAQAGADIVVPNRDKSRIAAIFTAHMAARTLPAGQSWPMLDEEQLVGPVRRARALLKIQDGCTASCTYCTARQARGPLRSKSLAVAVQEARRLVEAGHREIVLTGINLGQYAPDASGEMGLVQLLNTLVTALPGARFRLSSLGPESVTPALIGLMARTPAICPHLHIPLQSGDNTMLRRMGRSYTANDYETHVRHFLHRVPGGTFGADVMVGFPGEDATAHHRTLNLLDRLRPLNTHVFRFNPRPGTLAATFRPRVSPQEATARAAEVARRSTRWSLAARAGLLGRDVQVITEALHDGAAWGYSENYLYVGFPTQSSARGTINPVRIAYVDPVRALGVKQDRRYCS